LPAAQPLEPFEEFLKTLLVARNEEQKRQAFIVLAARGFDEGGRFATDLALSAEYRLEFRKSGVVSRGVADSFYQNLVIEFEYDLAKTLAHAQDQLRGYVAGAWRADRGKPRRPYLAVASDGARWEIYAPRPINSRRPVDQSNVHLEPSESWPNPGEGITAESLRSFLNRLFFRKEPLAPTAQNFARDFGLESPAYLNASAVLGVKLSELRRDPQVRVLRQTWSDSLQISYGSVAADDELYVKHTYLAMLARLLVWAALERRQLNVGELDSVLDGEYFKGVRRIANLAEYDFFQWHALPSATDARAIWLAVANHLAGYDLSHVGEDVLKPLYEQLVDPASRHELGEFYTPDWLASLVVERVLKDWDWKTGLPSILDPACGSGTFLRVAIEQIRNQAATTPRTLHADILGNIVGVDIHPLAVTISKATYLLAIKDLVSPATPAITVPVFLANSLHTPPMKETASLFVETMPVEVGPRTFDLPVDFIRHGRDFEQAIDDVLDIARSYAKSGRGVGAIPRALAGRVGNRYLSYQDPKVLVETLGDMAQHFAELIRARRDSIYGFMLKNHYRLAMLGRTFDVVVGNPPWLTVSAITTKSYKDRVTALATESNIAPRATGVLAHTELATLFLPQATNEFLKDRVGDQFRIAFVMPRSLLTAAQHRLLREGKYTALFDIREIWDLDGVEPLFNIPACVVFAARRNPRPTQPKPGQSVAGHLGRKDLPPAEAMRRLSITPTEFTLEYLGRRPAWVAGKDGQGDQGGLPSKSRNPYKQVFRQGAILYPQALFVVRRPDQATRDSGTVWVERNEQATAQARVLKDLTFRMNVSAKNLYLTAAAEHILPYALLSPLWTIVLPTLADPGDPAFRPCSVEALRQAGRVETAAWMEFAEARWREVRKDSEHQPLAERLDYIGQFSAQSQQRQFLALFTAAGNRPFAAFLDRASLPFPFVARDKTYWASFPTPEEAFFVIAFLNSDFVLGRIEDWMTRGLMGRRDVHTRPLDVPWPRFDRNDQRHARLTSMSAQLVSIAHQSLHESPPKQGTGKLRVWLRDGLAPDLLQETEELVSELSHEAEQVNGTRFP
jgi:SAM-dependent methyltransferase